MMQQATGRPGIPDAPAARRRNPAKKNRNRKYQHHHHSHAGKKMVALDGGKKMASFDGGRKMAALESAKKMAALEGAKKTATSDSGSKMAAVLDKMAPSSVESGIKTLSSENGNKNMLAIESANNKLSMESNKIKMDVAASVIDDKMDCDEDVMVALEEKLLEALALEPKYQPNLYLPTGPQEFGEITAGTRDGAAHVLRCLKVWYDLPSDVLFAAINLVDRFLTKMKVKPKHMACISVGSLYLACRQHSVAAPDPEDLVLISQCRCTAGDLTRMAAIVADKLGAQPGVAPVTALAFLRPLHAMFKRRALELGVLEAFESVVTEEDLIMRLEIVACDSACANVRPCELALVLLCTQLDSCVSQLDSQVAQTMLKLVDFAIHMQKQCRIPDSSFFHCHGCVVGILSRYNNQDKSPHRQRLVWKLSSRTLKLLRPTDRLTSLLPTIAEDGALPRLRTGSVSSEDSEDTEDWPTSPLVPVCEQC